MQDLSLGLGCGNWTGALSQVSRAETLSSRPESLASEQTGETLTVATALFTAAALLLPAAAFAQAPTHNQNLEPECANTGWHGPALRWRHEPGHHLGHDHVA
jgi:hypothetical protein